MSSFVLFKRLFAISFLISLAWNWIYLYKIAVAEHLNKVLRMGTNSEKCLGLKDFDWKDNLYEIFRTTFTFQPGPCEEYHKALIVDPFLTVSPIKVFSLTVTSLFTDPLKYIGQGISEFLRALLKDLPITVQIPVLIATILAILIFMYGSAQAVSQQDHPPPALEQPQAKRLRGVEDNPQAGGDGHTRGLPFRGVVNQTGNRDGERAILMKCKERNRTDIVS